MCSLQEDGVKSGDLNHRRLGQGKWEYVAAYNNLYFQFLLFFIYATLFSYTTLQNTHTSTLPLYVSILQHFHKRLLCLIISIPSISLIFAAQFFHRRWQRLRFPASRLLHLRARNLALLVFGRRFYFYFLFFFSLFLIRDESPAIPSGYWFEWKWLHCAMLQSDLFISIWICVCVFWWHRRLFRCSGI